MKPLPIPSERKSGRGHIVHYKLNGYGRETKVNKEGFKESSIHMVICFLQINVVGHIMSNFLEDTDIITCSPIRKKTALIRANYRIQ